MAAQTSDLIAISRSGTLYKVTVADILALAGAASDPWTYVKVTSDFTNSTTSLNDTPLSFTPPANSVVLFESMMLLRADATTTGPRPGIKPPTAGVEFVGNVEVATGATATTRRMFGPSASQVAATAFPTANESWWGWADGTLVTGASVTGNLVITLSSEIAASVVTLRTGSWLRWRTI